MKLRSREHKSPLLYKDNINQFEKLNKKEKKKRIMEEPNAAGIRHQQNVPHDQPQEMQRPQNVGNQRLIGAGDAPNMYDNRYGIVPPEIQRGDFDIPGNVLQSIQNKPYNGFQTENPIDHLLQFERSCNLTKKAGVSDDALKLRLFPFSLSGAAAQWEHNLTPGTITTWEQCRTAFLSEFYTPNRTAKIRAQITGFAQFNTETFSEAWTRFKKYQLECPHHGIQQDSLLSTFYRGLTSENRRMLDTASNGNFLLNTIENGLSLIVNMANSDAIYGSDNDRTNRRPIDAEYSKNKDIKELKDKLDKLLLGQQRSYDVNMVSDDPSMQNEEAYYVQNNYRNQNQPYAPFRNHPNFSYKNVNNAANPQDLIQPNPNPPPPRPFVPRPQYNNTYRQPYQPPQPQQQQQPTPPDVTAMLQQIMKEQTAHTAELSVIRNEFNRKIDGIQTDMVNRFENLNSRVQFLEGHITSTSNVAVSGQLPGKPLKNPKEYNVLSISVGSTHTSSAADNGMIAEDNNFTEGESSLKQDKADIEVRDEIKVEKVQEMVDEKVEHCCNAMSPTGITLDKKDDPGTFALPCSIKGMNFPECICDTGAGISVISLPVSHRLGFYNLEPCDYVVRLADNSLTETYGMINNVPVEVGPKTVLTDLVVMDIKGGSADTILLGRPFLMSAKAVIDMVNQTIELDPEGDHKMVFDSKGKLLHSPKATVETGSNSDYNFWLDPTENEGGVKEYTVLGGRKFPMPHERSLNSKPRCIGPFGIGRNTSNGKIAMIASKGTMLPLTGHRMQLYLMEPDKTAKTQEPEPVTPGLSTNTAFPPNPDGIKVHTKDGEEKGGTGRYIPLHLRKELRGDKKKDTAVWDTLGEPNGHYDFYVKYTPPPWAGMDTKDIIPSGWDEPERTPDPLTEPHV